MAASGNGCVSMSDSPDYKKMYLKLFRASEEAVNLLIQVQRECEELYISSPELKASEAEP